MTTDTLNVEITRDDDGVKIVEYNRTEAALAALEKQYQGATFAVTTADGMKAAKAARKELRELRVDLEKKRKALKAPVLDYTRALDGQAKAITVRIEDLEVPIDRQIKDEEARKAREKAEAEAAERRRIDAHRRVIEEIRNKPLALIGATADELEEAFYAVQQTDLSGLEEFQAEAGAVKDEAAGKLYELFTQAKEAEAAAEREAEARREREAAEAQAAREREAELAAELEELRAFKAKQEADARQAEEEKNRAARKSLETVQQNPRAAFRVPAEYLGMDPGAGDDVTPAAEPARQVAFDVDVEWSGYSRGHSTYRVMAADASEAMARWTDGELVEHSVVRDDTEKEPVAAMATEIKEGAS